MRWREHKAKAGSVVVIDVVTGEMLALANYPSFHPSMRTKVNQDDFGEAARNRALTDVFEPGSVMKPFVAAWALRAAACSRAPCCRPAAFSVGGRPIHDTHPREQMTVTEIVQRSSNIGAAKLAMQMEPRELWELYSNVGFGQRPQIEFPGAVSGRAASVQERGSRSTSRGWRSATGCRRRCCRWRAPTPCSRATASWCRSRCSARTSPRPACACCRPKWRARCARCCSWPPRRAAPRRARRRMGYSVGGKTGTAHAYDGGEYVSNKHRAWFVGMAPMSNPRMVVAVMVDQPSAGRPLRRRRGRAGVQPGGAADPAPAQRAARHRGAASDRRADASRKPRPLRRPGPVDGACSDSTTSHGAVQWLRARRGRCAAHRQPAGAGGRCVPGLGRCARRRAPPRGRRAGRRRRALPGRRRRRSTLSASTMRALPPCRRLKAAAGVDCRCLVRPAEPDARGGGGHRHQRQDVGRLVDCAGPERARPTLRRDRHARRRRAAEGGRSQRRRCRPPV